VGLLHGAANNFMSAEQLRRSPSFAAVAVAAMKRVLPAKRGRRAMFSELSCASFWSKP
jgi:hypothetical protein